MQRRGVRILVAESNPLLLMAIGEILEADGYEVLTAEDGTQALHLLDHPDEIDLIITSLGIDGADGFELARKAKTHGQPVPVVFTSGRSDLPLATAHPPARSHRLEKPYNLTDLRKAIDDLLDHPGTNGNLV
jgi:CheY-like chemotaxis protein